MSPEPGCVDCGAERAVAASGNAYNRCRACLNRYDSEKKRGRRRTRRRAAKAPDGDGFEQAPLTRVRPNAAERGARPAILLREPERRAGGPRCGDCGGTFERVTLVRSGTWTGALCDLCLVEARQWGAEVEELAAG